MVTTRLGASKFGLILSPRLFFRVHSQLLTHLLAQSVKIICAEYRNPKCRIRILTFLSIHHLILHRFHVYTVNKFSAHVGQNTAVFARFMVAFFAVYYEISLKLSCAVDSRGYFFINVC